VNISSRAILGKTYRTVYSAGKAALVGITRTLCLELGADGITINALAPGPVATELF
jgi:NAD(P)-dependent dehydrogenase (short-subunit alcohol dehydrogenase family)